MSPAQPPPLPTRRSDSTLKIVLGVFGAIAVLGVACVAFAVWYVSTSGITRPIDKMFGDQHLKTAVALIELHKTRYGRYPESLRELKFTGDWDSIALNALSYHTNREGTAYYIEVERGWASKPALNMPPEFWQGTGFTPALKPTQ